MYLGIEQSKNWKAIMPISKSWSSDKEYLITTDTDERLLLRLSDISRFEAKKKEFDIIKNMQSLISRCQNRLRLEYVMMEVVFICCLHG